MGTKSYSNPYSFLIKEYLTNAHKDIYETKHLGLWFLTMQIMHWV